MIRDTVRQFVRDRVLPDVGDWFEEGGSRASWPRELGEARAARHAPRGLRLRRRERVAYGLACMELEAGDSGVRSARLRAGLAGDVRDLALGLRGAEAATGCRAMAAGEAIGCFGLTEPDAGSDPGAMRTRARRDGGDWILNGAEDVDHERLDRRRRGRLGADGRRRHPRLPGRAGTRASRAPDIHKKISLRASVTSELVLDDVRLPGRRDAARGDVPARPAVVPERGALRHRLGRRRRRRARASRRRSTTRRSGSRSAGRSRRTSSCRRSWPRWRSRSTARTLLALHLGRMKDEGTLRPEHVSMGKLGNVRGALEVARTAREVLGANGITLEYPVIRHMNNLESVVTYEGTADIHALVDRRRADRHPGVPVTRAATRTQQHAVDWLRQAIVAGELRPGERDHAGGRRGADRRQPDPGARGAARARAGGAGDLPAAPRLLRHRAAASRTWRRSTSCGACSRRRRCGGRCRRSTTTRLRDDARGGRLRGGGRRAATSRASWRPTGASTSRSSAPAQPHALRLIRLLWDSTEAYRAIYYNSAGRARGRRSTRTGDPRRGPRARRRARWSPSSTRTASARSPCCARRWRQAA